MTKHFFVTGTNTSVGKTRVTGLLAKHFLDQQERVVTQKWVQSGCHEDDDIITHLSLMNVDKARYEAHQEDMCPYRLVHPSAPHLAAELEGVTIDLQKLKDSFLSLTQQFDRVIVEGSGGLLMPFDRHAHTTLADLVAELNLHLVIVMDNVLGAINHTLLTIEAAQHRKIPIEGIIVNHTKPSSDALIASDNPKIITALTGISVMGVLPWGGEALLF